MTFLPEDSEDDHACRSGYCADNKHWRCGLHCVLCDDLCACHCHEMTPETAA